MHLISLDVRSFDSCVETLLEDALDFMEAPWPVLDPALVGFLQSTFHSARNLQCAFDNVDDCCNLIQSRFPDMIDEDLRNAAAVLLAWKDGHSRDFKRARLTVVGEVFARLPAPMATDLGESFNNISKTLKLFWHKTMFPLFSQKEKFLLEKFNALFCFVRKVS